jgi:hypothetical protein
LAFADTTRRGGSFVPNLTMIVSTGRPCVPSTSMMEKSEFGKSMSS